MTRAFLQMVPIIFAIIVSFAWSISSPALVSQYPHYFYLAVGFIISRIVGKLVIARVCRQDFKIVHFLLLPLLFGLVNSHYGFMREETLVKIYCLVGILSYFHFALSIIYDFTHHLGIHCLSIPIKKIQ